MVAIAVLTIGMLSVAALATVMLTTGKRSKYMTLASTLASEKLEDLSRWPSDQPQVCVPTGSTTAGSLTTDNPPANITCPPPIGGGAAATGSASYNDDVSISFNNSSTDCPTASGGCFAETVSSLNGTTVQYTTTYHSPDGRIVTPNATTTANTRVTFHRRWLIESDTPVAGVRRVTVLVTLQDASVQPTVRFQMSAVRP
jgi:Tfp pilus assembly protein PilV